MAGPLIDGGGYVKGHGIAGPHLHKGGKKSVPVAPSRPRTYRSATAHTHTQAGPKAPPKTAGPVTSGSGSSGSGGSVSSGGASGGISGAEKRAVARENKAKHKAGNRFKRQAATLEGQVESLRKALATEFDAALQVKLANVAKVLAGQQLMVNDGYSKRLAGLVGAEQDNDTSFAEQSQINTGNRVRERNSAVAQAVANGAGETDVLQAQLMSLRNWQANQAEVARSYLDTLRSVNSSLTDLNVDTKTALGNNEIQSNADKEQLWTNYYNQRSQAYTQLGNTLGQQADYLDSAKEMGVGKGGKGKTQAAKDAWMDAAKETGKAWENPGLSPETQAWQGHETFKPGRLNSSRLEAATTVDLAKKPEGASLRRWTP